MRRKDHAGSTWTKSSHGPSLSYLEVGLCWSFLGGLEVCVGALYVCVLRSGAEKYKRVQVNPRENEPRELW